MELLQLRYFYESAKTESFTKTAEKFMVPTTSVSASVKRLEKELGQALFDRSSNRITLNANGKKLQQSLCLVFSELDGAVGEIAAGEADDRVIRLLVRGMRQKITDLIIEYNARYPQVAFETVFDFRETSADDYDIIIDEKNDGYPGYSRFELYRMRLRLKCRAGDPLCGKKLTLKQLRNRKFISMGEESNMQRILTNACRRVGFLPEFAVLCNDIACSEKFVASGMGIGIGRDDGPAAAKAGMDFLDVRDFDEEYTVYAYYKEEDHYGNIKSFLDFLKSKTV